MKRPTDNPHLPSDFEVRLAAGLPGYRPLMLTAVQQFALPVSCGSSILRSPGAPARVRDRAAAVLELAKRGHTASAEDLSLRGVHVYASHRSHEHRFLDLIRQVAKEHYPDDIFDFQGTRERGEFRGGGVVTYRGQRPR